MVAVDDSLIAGAIVRLGGNRTWSMFLLKTMLSVYEQHFSIEEGELCISIRQKLRLIKENIALPFPKQKNQ